MLDLFESLKFLLPGAGCLSLPSEAVAGELLNELVTRSFLLSLLLQNLLFVGGCMVPSCGMQRPTPAVLARVSSPRACRCR